MVTQNTMKALRLTANSNQKPNVALTHVRIPEPSPRTALVKICAAAINPSDIFNAKGGFHHTTFPRIPGRDYAGVVVDGPEEWKGREVYGTSGDSLGFSADGTHAQYCLIPIDGLALKPSNLNFAQAATVGVPFTTASLVLRRSNVQSTDVVLVLGAAGAVGSATCQLAEELGCKVLRGSHRDTADVNLARDPEMRTVARLTEGKGPDVIIDTTGSLDILMASVRCLARRGRLAYISAPKVGSTECVFDVKHIYREEKVLIGCNSALSTLKETAKDMATMRPQFETGKLRAVGEEQLEKTALENAVTAYDSTKSGGGRKVVIVFE